MINDNISLDDVYPDVILVGGGLTLVVNAGPVPPANTWTSYGVTLTENAGWRKDYLDGPAPTSDEFRAVLGSLEALRIRGEFGNGPETASLDNVAVVVPEPLAMALVSGLGLGLFGLLRSRWLR